MARIKTITFSIIAFVTSLNAYADNFIVIGKEAKVFDEPNSKGYVTLNTKNEEIILQPGMSFKILDNAQGWYVIEYSPGLRGYLSEQVKVTPVNLPLPGSYSVKNNPSQKLNVTGEEGKWSATMGNKQYQGQVVGNIVIFLDEKKVPAYSLVDIGSGPIVMTYDNSVTKFF